MAGSGSAEVRTPIFSGENYEFWRIKMVTIFKSYGLWNLVEKGISVSDSKKKKAKTDEDTDVDADDDEKMTAIFMKDAKALGIIQNAVSDQIFPRIANTDSAKMAWDLLYGEYHSGDQWIVEESAAPISHATFSCDSQSVYASFTDGTVRIFTSNLQLQCQINPNAYFPPDVSSSASHPLVVAAHTQEPNQFAIGLTDGAVIIFEPLKSEDKWGVPPPVDNGLHTTNEGSLGIGSKRWVQEANVSF